MRPFELLSPQTIPDALSEGKANEGSRYIAGGTNLVDLMKEDVERPRVLIDIANLGMDQISEMTGGGLRLGASVSNADTAYHPLVQKRYPLLAQAILAGASPQLRNMATNGGNMMQRTRCYYFYDTDTACNKREPGSGCAAKTGFNRIHAILGHSEHCIATYPSDMANALAALDATLQLEGPNGERKMKLVDFHRLPGDTPEQDNNLKPGELITAIELPPLGFAEHCAYLKLRDRQSYAFALVAVAAAFEFEDGKISEARLALGGVAHKPWRDQQAEAMMQGQAPGAQLFSEVAEKVLAGASGFDDNNFKIPLARKAIVRALSMATEGRKDDDTPCYR